MAGLLTRPGHRAFPVLHQWQKFDVRFCGLTAAGTVPDFHRVPFSFGRRKPPETISGCKIIYITCHIQTIHIIFTIKHTKHDNRVALIRAFKFTTNEDGNYHTQYP